MDPGPGISQNPDRASDRSTPQRHRVADDQIGFPAQETRVRLQYALFAAIALFSMAVFFYSALCLSLHIQHFNFRPMTGSAADETAEPWTLSLSLSMHDQTVPSAFLKTSFDKGGEAQESIAISDLVEGKSNHAQLNLASVDRFGFCV